MKIYLAGPMRGYPSFNFPAFHHAAAILRSGGHEVFSPAEHDLKRHGAKIQDNPTGDEKIAEATVGFSIREALGADCAWICANAECVALLPGWQESKGAQMERALAVALGIQVIELNHGFLPEKEK